MKLSLGLLGVEALTGGDFAAVRDVVALADKKGVDQVSAIDHVVMGESHDEYPYGVFRGTSRSPFLDPLVELATYAAVTNNIRLSTGVVVSPLRPAVVLAKQIASLDVLSRGRVEIGLGVGWQSAEYRACGVDWNSRFAILEEQIRLCRALWGGTQVSFQGEHVQVENVTAMPQPLQGARLP
ncbi:MAG TPA: LLM class flavin-dependent oxidoreductase, partial [Caulobacteraceae bacterium]|nr:LLM class flavin-dependent oxidoreductase [Caulobacteraceae bacterium]